MDDDLPPRIPGVLPARSTSGLREATRSRLVFEEPENGMTSRSLCALRSHKLVVGALR